MMDEREIVEWLDNTTKPTGIQKWCWRFLPEFTGNKTPEFHDQMFREMLFNYYVGHQNKYHRRSCFISFRESAKTTIAALAIPLYTTVFKGNTSYLEYKGKIYELKLGEDLICILSKVSYAAESRLVNVRNNLGSPSRITEYFGTYKPVVERGGKVVKWTRDEFCIKSDNGLSDPGDTMFVSFGALQHIRGNNEEGYRPTLIIPDDIYSNENVGTPERRAKIAEWFYTEVMNSIDNVKGKIILIGTMVHEDTVFTDIRNQAKQENASWRLMETSAMDPDEFNGILAKIDYDRWGTHFNMPPTDTVMQWQKECKSLAWPDRTSLEVLLNVYRDGLIGRKPDDIYQEYFNIIKSPESKNFLPSMFKHGTIEYTYDVRLGEIVNWIRINGIWFNANIYIGVDLASCIGNSADDTVIFISAFCSNHQVAILRYECGKMGLRDELKAGQVHGEYKVKEFRRDLSLISKRGVVDETLRMADLYHPKLTVIESIQEQLKVYQEITNIARYNNMHVPTMPFKPTTNKIERITNILLPHYQVGAVIHQEGMQTLEYQLEFLGRASHDDIPDAEHMSFMYGRFPEPLDFDKKVSSVTNIQTYDVSMDWMQY